MLPGLLPLSAAESILSMSSSLAMRLLLGLLGLLNHFLRPVIAPAQGRDITLPVVVPILVRGQEGLNRPGLFCLQVPAIGVPRRVLEESDHGSTMGHPLGLLGLSVHQEPHEPT